MAATIPDCDMPDHDRVTPTAADAAERLWEDPAWDGYRTLPGEFDAEIPVDILLQR